MERIAELIEMLNDGELELLKAYVEQLKHKGERSSKAPVILEIPYKFPSLNEYINECRKNKYAGARMKKDIQADIGYFINKLPHFETPVHIKFIWVEGNENRDYDNVSAAHKFILDALVSQGKLKDDNRKCVVGFEDVFQYGDEFKVILEITEEG